MPSTTLVAFFFTFHIIGGQLGMALILGTIALTNKVQKHPLLISFLVTWMLFSASFCLLLYFGHQFDPQKPLPLCIAQLSMIYGAAISTPLAGLALIFHIWLSVGRLAHFTDTADVKADLDESREPEYSRRMTSFLVIAPYVAFVTTALYFLLEESSDPSLVDRTQDGLYCRLRPDQQRTIPYISGMIILACVVLEVLLVVKLLKFKRISNWPKAKLTSRKFVQLFIRTGIFTLYAILSLLAAVAFWFETSKEIAFPHVVQALLPMAAFLIFGTQKDILTAWRVIPLWNRLIWKSSSVLSPARDEHFEISLVRSGASSADKPIQTRLPEVPRPVEVSTSRVGRPLFTYAEIPRSFTPSLISISSARA